jgi:hypothetical protein
MDRKPRESEAFPRAGPVQIALHAHALRVIFGGAKGQAGSALEQGAKRISLFSTSDGWPRRAYIKSNIKTPRQLLGFVVVEGRASRRIIDLTGQFNGLGLHFCFWNI